MHYVIHCEMTEEFTVLVTKNMIELLEECKKEGKVFTRKKAEINKQK